MKADIHPKVNTKAKVTCACGNTFETISTKDTISVEICSACHPFYTGQQKFVDTEGRIDKFERKKKIAEGKKQKAQELKKIKDAKKKKTSNTPGASQATLKDMLETARKDKA